jgi:hypothetical protein
MLGELVQHLYTEGMTAYEKKDDNQALAWFAQCLDVLRQLGQNVEWYSAICYQVGLLFALHGEAEQSTAFLDAVGTIQQQQPPDAPTVQTLIQVGKILAQIGQPGRARRLLESAAAMAATLGGPAEGPAGEILTSLQEIAVVPACDWEFTIRLELQPASRFTVTAGGEIIWSDFRGELGAVPLGSGAPWNVVWMG